MSVSVIYAADSGTRYDENGVEIWYSLEVKAGLGSKVV
jgi:hypothetical protein